MINPLRVASDGYLKNGATKALLVIATAGYLAGAGVVPPTGGIYTPTARRIPVRRKIVDHEKARREKVLAIQRADDELLAKIIWDIWDIC